MVCEITLTIGWPAIMAIIGFSTLILATLNTLIKVTRNHKLLMDSKVNVTDYKEHCNKNEVAFKEIRDTQIAVQLETNRILGIMSKNIGILKNDVKWLTNGKEDALDNEN